MMPTKEQIEGELMTVYSWNSGCPYIKGMTYPDALNWYKGEKAKALNFLKKMLDVAEADKGNDYAMKVWMEMRSALHRADYTKGPIRIFKAIYKKASLKIQQKTKDDPKRVGAILENALWKPTEGLFE